MRTVLMVVLVLLGATGAFAQEALPEPSADAPVLSSVLELLITSASDTASANTRLEFDVALRNAGGQALKVKKLDETGLECDINGQPWGKITGEAPVVVLEPGESLRRKFRIRGVDTPGPFKLVCTYSMRSNGVRPTAYKIINIIK